MIAIALRVDQSDVSAVSWAFWTGLIVSFGLQKFFTFSDTRTQRRLIIKQVAAVTALVLFNYVFTILVTKVSEGLLPVVASRTVALLITTLWNYYLYKTSIFRGAVEQIY